MTNLGVPILTRLATTHDLDAAADTLAAAFADYAWTRHVIPQQDYAERLHSLQQRYLAHAVTHGLVVVYDDYAGVAALLPPRSPEPAPAVIAEIVSLHGDRAAFLDSGLPQATDPDAWTLETLGVRPEFQGHGIGSALLTAAMKEVQAARGMALRLETSDQRNVRLYQRHGFAVTNHVQPPVGPPTWAMSADFPTLGANA